MLQGTSGNGISRNENRCYCNVCLSSSVQKGLDNLDDISEKAKDDFLSAMNRVNLNAYTSVKLLPDNKIRKNFKGGNFSSANFMIVLTVLTALIIIAGIIFLILISKSTVHIPGIPLSHVYKWIGVGLGVTFFSYLLLGLGCFMGSKTLGDKKYKVINVLDRTNIRKLALEQREKWNDLDTAHRIFQLKVVALKRSIPRSADPNVVSRLLMLEDQLARVNVEYKALSATHTSDFAKLMKCRAASREVSSEYKVLIAQREELCRENNILRGKLDKLEK